MSIECENKALRLLVVFSKESLERSLGTEDISKEILSMIDLHDQSKTLPSSKIHRLMRTNLQLLI